MSGLKSGELLNVMGPLGNGFDLETPFDHAVIVAGGIYTVDHWNALTIRSLAIGQGAGKERV